MTNEDLQILQSFSALWARVQGEAPPGEPAQDSMQEILNRLYTACRAYGALAQDAGGTPRRQLLCMQHQATEMLRRLQAGLFLDTGDTCTLKAEEKICKFNAINLQKLWRNANALQGLCDGAEPPGEGITASDLAAVRQLGAAHSRALRTLLEGIL